MFPHLTCHDLAGVQRPIVDLLPVGLVMDHADFLLRVFSESLLSLQIVWIRAWTWLVQRDAVCAKEVGEGVAVMVVNFVQLVIYRSGMESQGARASSL